MVPPAIRLLFGGVCHVTVVSNVIGTSARAPMFPSFEDFSPVHSFRSTLSSSQELLVTRIDYYCSFEGRYVIMPAREVIGQTLGQTVRE